jgi:hypothetical protein
MDVAADLSPAEISMRALAVTKPPGAAGSADARVTLAGGVATAVEPFAFTAAGTSVTGRAALAPGDAKLRSLDASATISARDAAHAPGRVTLTVAPADAAGHTFAVTSNDAGALFREIAPEADATGGRLSFAGTVELGGPGFPIDGRLELHDFKLLRAPVLARVATLASLSGLAKLFQEGGMVFDRLEAGIASRGTTVTIANAVARGPSVNLAVDGMVERAERTAALHGTLVPSYYGINTATGRIPIVGGIVTGKERQGIQAFDFDVSGPLASPRVAVRLSSVAPGVLRDLSRRVSETRRSAPQ